mmetsp:Transcript_28110/g.68195  ORF Transcript_28110/g.68195 Transcript_28110/m.68195 type:complete len:932 (+) Transcript_28110:113-2908(+)
MPLRTAFQLTRAILSSKRNENPGGTSTSSKSWHSYVVTLASDTADPNSTPRSATIEHAYEGTGQQHEIRWKSTISMQINGEAVELEPARANVQEFPSVRFANVASTIEDDYGDAVNLVGLQLEVFERLLLATLDETKDGFWSKHDGVMCKPIHALALSNTEEAISLLVHLVTGRPELLLDVHGEGFFTGENLLHVLIVNRREEYVCQLLDIAITKLPRDQAKEVMEANARGKFFHSLPQRYFGGSVLGYAASFGMRAAVHKMIHCHEPLKEEFAGVPSRLESAKEIQFVSLNSLFDIHTGFYPIHAVIALGLHEMLDWLLDDLPSTERANYTLKTEPSNPRIRGLPAGLSPLQLAVYFGRGAPTASIMKKHMRLQWKWGPMKCEHLFLDEIDSVGSGGKQVMDLVTSLDARKQTKMMLLDSFLDGWLFKLYVAKWKTIYWEHVALIMLQVLHIISLLNVSFNKPRYSDVPIWSSVLQIVSCLLLCEEEFREIFLWARDQGQEHTLTVRLQTFLRERIADRLVSKVISWCCSLLSAIFILTWGNDVGVQNWRTEVAPMLLSIAILFSGVILIADVFVTYESTGRYVIVVNQMLQNDVLKVLIILAPFLFTFSSAMWPVLPTDRIYANDDVFGFLSVLWSMTIMVFTGDSHLELVGDTTDLSTLTSPQFALLFNDFSIARQLIPDVLVVILYFCFVVFSLVLMLNLLIAQMSDTYEETFKEGQLRWRWEFARRVLRLETLNSQFSQIPVGVMVDGPGGPRYTVEMIRMEKTIEGGDYESESGGYSGDLFSKSETTKQVRGEGSNAEVVQALSKMQAKLDSILQGGIGPRFGQDDAAKNIHSWSPQRKPSPSSRNAASCRHGASFLESAHLQQQARSQRALPSQWFRSSAKVEPEFSPGSAVSVSPIDSRGVGPIGFTGSVKWRQPPPPPPPST